MLANVPSSSLTLCTTLAELRFRFLDYCTCYLKALYYLIWNKVAPYDIQSKILLQAKYELRHDVSIWCNYVIAGDDNRLGMSTFQKNLHVIPQSLNLIFIWLITIPNRYFKFFTLSNQKKKKKVLHVAWQSS